ncbi:unnamed protein product [Moneuplotes crassus]|uniref:Uncharacterized protein n=1 Tax=Euplotes crassus TaxID=5936 RepID=A0AAD1XVI7_EUPCR|nr:unnamed protein product [Moneuplotes crassus]
MEYEQYEQEVKIINQQASNKFCKIVCSEIGACMFNPFHYTASLEFLKDFKLFYIGNFDSNLTEQHILVSQVRLKYFNRMIEEYSKKQEIIRLALYEDSPIFRHKRAINNVIRGVHTLKDLKINSLTITSKQFVQILLSGTNLEKFNLVDCTFIGAQFVITVGKRTSRLKSFEMRCDKISLREKVGRNFEYFDNILSNICQCPCVKTLEVIRFERTGVVHGTPEAFEQKYSHLNLYIN